MTLHDSDSTQYLEVILPHKKKATQKRSSNSGVCGSSGAKHSEKTQTQLLYYTGKPKYVFT